jgi:hypothetical protein
MKCNVGDIVRKLRIFLGLAIIAAGIYFQSWWGVIGLISLLTATVGWCPAYLAFGMSTINGCCNAENKSTAEQYF